MRYKNISGQDQVVMGIGEVKAGGTLETSQPFENPNFELVTEGAKSQPEAPSAPEETVNSADKEAKNK